MKNKLFFILLFLSTSALSSQNDLMIYGSLQNVFLYQDYNLQLNEPIERDLFSYESNSFAVQQLDIFFTKLFDDKYKVFIDLEMKLNYSSEQGWGNINLQEAWMSYSHNNYFEVKAGMMFPKFNYLNEYKNRLAILPYLFRPMIYEQILSELIQFEDFIPEKAFLQFSGKIPLSKFYIEWAAYMGNAESSYIVDNQDYNSEITSSLFILGGTDFTDFDLKLYGTRIGILKKDESIRFGISATYDSDNRNNLTTDELGNNKPILGDVPRVRIGSDLGLKYKGFELEAELIRTFYNYDTSDIPNLELGQFFIYGMLLYNFTDRIYAFGGHQIRTDEFYNYDSNCPFVGGGFRLNNSITCKLQYSKYWHGIERGMDNQLVGETFLDLYMMGVSVLF